MNVRYWAIALWYVVIPGFLSAVEVPAISSLPGHPRLLMSTAQLQSIKNGPSDELRNQLKAYLYALADAATETDIQTYSQITSRFSAQFPSPSESELREQGLRTARRVQGLLLTWAMASRIAEVVDNDRVKSERWARRAIRQMATVSSANFQWDPARDAVLPGRADPLNGQFLNVAEMALGVSIAYDWLWHRGTWWVINGVDQRPLVRQALYDKALRWGADAYGDAPSSYTTFWVNGAYNWTQVCNTGLLAAALALAGDSVASGPNQSALNMEIQRVIDGACRSLESSQSMYQPAGVYPEGLGYWAYGTVYQVLAIGMLESTLGSTSTFATERVQPLWNSPGFQKTAAYRMAMIGPTGNPFTYSDTGFVQSATTRTDGPSLPLIWLGLRFNDLHIQNYHRTCLDNDLPKTATSTIDDGTFFGFYAYPLLYLWMPPSANTDPLRDLTFKDDYFPGRPLGNRGTNAVELAIFRNQPTQTDDWWVAMKGGASGNNHSHHDLGSFSMDFQGVRWAEDLGADDYGLPGYGDDHHGGSRWEYLLCGTQGHNTLSPGGMQQHLVALAPITLFSSTATSAKAVVDLTALYPGMGHRIMRGVEMVDARQQVLLQDDVQALPAGVPLLWRMMTKASIVVESGNPRNLILTRSLEGVPRTLRLEVLHPGNAEVSIQAVDSLQNGSVAFPGYSRITVRVPPSSAPVDRQILVRFRASDRSAFNVGSAPRNPVWNWTAESASPLMPPTLTIPTSVAVSPGSSWSFVLTGTAKPWTTLRVTNRPSWLVLDEVAGRLYGEVPTDFAAKVTMNVQATNSAGSCSASLTMAPAARVLAVLISDTLTFTRGSAITSFSGSSTVSLVQASSLQSSWYERPFSIRAWGLPPGVTMKPWLAVGGTPTQAGRYDVQIEAQHVFGVVRGTVTMIVQDTARADQPTLSATPSSLDLP